MGMTLHRNRYDFRCDADGCRVRAVHLFKERVWFNTATGQYEREPVRPKIRSVVPYFNRAFEARRREFGPAEFGLTMRSFVLSGSNRAPRCVCWHCHERERVNASTKPKGLQQLSLFGDEDRA